MNFDFWHRQDPKQPLFPDIEWQKPEQRQLAGKLLLVGGNKLGFAAVAQAYNDALVAGVGECRAVLPDSLKKVIDPRTFEAVVVPSNPSGGMSKEALPNLQAAAQWADATLIIGDTGRNSETAIVLETFLTTNDELAIITRDAIDLLRSSMPTILNRPETVLIVTLAQLQKIFQSVYYPKLIVFSIQLALLAEHLHKFTVSYPVSIVVFHQNYLMVARDGEVSSTPWEEPLKIWRGSVAARAAVYALQNKKKVFQALTASLVQAKEASP